jgi:hypothetical protein
LGLRLKNSFISMPVLDGIGSTLSSLHRLNKFGGSVSAIALVGPPFRWRNPPFGVSFK